MSWTTAILSFAATYALLALITGPYIRRWDNAKTEAVLAKYREYCKQRDKQYPEMIGNWGKP